MLKKKHIIFKVFYHINNDINTDFRPLTTNSQGFYKKGLV